MAPTASGGASATVGADALSIPKAKELANFLRAGHGEGARLVSCRQSADGSAEGLTIEMSVSVPQRPVNDIKPKPESTEAMYAGVDTRVDGQGRANRPGQVPIDGDEGGVK